MLDVLLLEGQLVWNFPLLSGLVCIGVIYILVIRSSYRQMRFHSKQPFLFFLSLLLLYITIGTPLSVINHVSFSFHMIQMSLLFFVIPPLFILGLPETYSHSIKALNMPSMAALITFAVLLFLYHLPAVLTYLSLHSMIHSSYLLLLMFLSFLIWGRIVMEQNKQFAFLSGLVLMPACGLLIVNGLFGSTANPLLSKIMTTLCLTPSSLNSLHPALLNTRVDLILAGGMMIFIHKSALLFTTHLKSKVLTRDLTRNG
ncbi:cytochrome c oxidase assembly protein [Bacillus sp. USDA818B3_A]|uniref:cytochrome c oxidase assembly protein n=1 Tax=Bacillus sp. USDA818B3_A TaxID=2698834 RepID=UPI00137156C1|nr:cytochrome c oxidase assembly protein [Bacillus sp. USDA818B3_A]